MEESKDTNPIKKHPSLPANYVTLAMLKERWLQRKKEEEEEEKVKQQFNLKQVPNEEIATGSKHGAELSTRNQNRQKLRPDDAPRRRQQPLKDPESGDSVAIRGNQAIRGGKTKMVYRERKPRAPGNVSGKESVPHPGHQVGELGDNEKKEEEGFAGPRVMNTGFDNRKNVNERMRINGSGRGWQQHGYMGCRRTPSGRVDQAENRLMWVKKGETPGDHATDFNPQVHP